MTKNIIRLFYLISGFIISQPNAQSQTIHVEGNSYSGIVSLACKMFQDGGYEMRTYNILNFRKDSVDVSFEIKTIDESENQVLSKNQSGHIATYPYQIQKKKDSPNYLIRINGYKYFLLEISDNQLEDIGSMENIVFRQNKPE